MYARLPSLSQRPAPTTIWPKQPKRSGKRQKSDLGSIICERINKGAALGDLVVPRERKDSKLEQECEKRIKLISAKLDERNVRAGIRLAASDNSVAPFDNNIYEKLQSKHPPRAPNHAQQNVEDSLITFEPIVAKAINSFPSGSSGRPSLLVPQLYKDLIAKSNGSVGNEFLQKLTSVLNIVLEGKVPVGLRPFFFGAKLIGLRKKDGGIRPIAVGNTLRRICSKCVSSFATDQRRIDFHGTQFGCGTSGAEIAEHVFRNLIENEQNPENVILKMDFKNAFNSLKHDKILDTVFENDARFTIIRTLHIANPHIFSSERKLFNRKRAVSKGTPKAQLSSPTLFKTSLTKWFHNIMFGTSTTETFRMTIGRFLRTSNDLSLAPTSMGYHSRKLNVT